MNTHLSLAMAEVSFAGFAESIPQLLDQTRLKRLIRGQERILLKPNLVSTDPAPITTPVELVEEVVKYLKPFGIPIVIGEGTATTDFSSLEVFRILGYERLLAHGVTLLDLNEEPLVKLKRPGCTRWPSMHLPKIAMESFLVSIPQLKAHSLSGVTLTMKNLMGLAPPSHYRQGGHWNKSAFHQRIDEAVYELNLYRKADFTILDASVGMAEAHLWGPTCDPPVAKLVAGENPLEMDKRGCELLGLDWREVGHLRLAEERGL